MTNIPPQLQIEIQRAKARESLFHYACYVDPKFKPHWYHKVVADTLTKWARHEIMNLVIVLPPRHGKTQLASLAVSYLHGPWALDRPFQCWERQRRKTLQT